MVTSALTAPLPRELLACMVCTAILTLAGHPRGARGQCPQAGHVPSTRAVRVEIATARTTYRPEDTVAVRLILTNTGPVPLAVRQAPPWYAVRLVVTGAHGQVIAPGDDPDDRFYRTGRPYVLTPHVPDTAGYERHQWTGLQHWGYGPLSPGRYALTAVPLAAGYDMVVDTETVRSNRVTITVTAPRRR